MAKNVNVLIRKRENFVAKSSIKPVVDIVPLVVVVLERVDMPRNRVLSKVQYYLLVELVVEDHSYDQGVQYYKAAAVVAVAEEGLHQVLLVVIVA